MSKNYTNTETWTVEDLVLALGETPNKKKKITIPKFQRTLVWRSEQKKEFIDSVKNGFPVGAILLYKSSTDNDGNDIYNLIDGLQRSTTLNQYTKSPTQFFDETNIGEDLFKQISPILEAKKPGYDEDTLNKELVEWVKQLAGFEESKGFASFTVANYLNEKLELSLELDAVKVLTEKFIPFLEKIKNESNISQSKIPILIFTGDQSHLPIIFERLNSKGTQLSKYQIYAATWSIYDAISINNRDVIENIKRKYDSLLEEGYEVENYESSPKFFTLPFSVFEYLFGFGKFLSNKYKYLFNDSIKIDQEDSIGFNVMNICMGLQFNEMEKLPEELLKHDLNILETAVVSSIDFVFNTLKGHITLKMNNKKRIPINHTELQIVSMIGKVFHSKYNPDLTEKESWKESEKKLKSNLPYHYLYDIVREHWKGSGDSKAFGLIYTDRYENPIAKKTWVNTLEDWFTNELEKKEKTRVNIKDSAVLFMKYLYAYSMTAYEELSNKEFDLEHLVPVDRLKDIAGDNGLPISAFSNLCLLESSLNRKKGSLTYYEYFKKQVEAGEITEEQAKLEIEKIEKYTFSTEADLQFVTDDFTPEKYTNFIKDRYSKVKDLFFKLNNIE